MVFEESVVLVRVSVFGFTNEFNVCDWASKLSSNTRVKAQSLFRVHIGNAGLPIFWAGVTAIAFQTWSHRINKRDVRSLSTNVLVVDAVQTHSWERRSLAATSPGLIAITHHSIHEFIISVNVTTLDAQTVARYFCSVEDALVH